MPNYSDPDFGNIIITVNPRARRVIMRPVVDGLRVTVPPYATSGDIKGAIDKFRPQLINKRNEVLNRHQTTDEEIRELRKQAKTFLPRRVAELAYMFGFEYKDLKIQSSKTRWGSCSGTNSINLSLYLMRVPEHLIDYVILHELCHTVHHDHSEAFWHLMDEVTNGQAKALRHELRKYNTA
ncbi:MAG: M48 family metallopeptidase [Bacteroidaceae bacterium]|nr:M48 family metallopeptidase [Bacteroidaceae bacterium]